MSYLSTKVKRAASVATKSAFGLGVKAKTARPACSRAARRFAGGLPVIVEVSIDCTDHQPSVFVKCCRFLIWALVLFITCVGVSSWVWLELDNLDDRAERIGAASLEYKLTRSLAKRDLYLEWQGFSWPRIYKVTKIRPDSKVGELVSVDQTGAHLIRPLGKSAASIILGDSDDELTPIVIELLSDDKGWYYEDEYTIFPPSQRGRG